MVGSNSNLDASSPKVVVVVTVELHLNQVAKIQLRRCLKTARSLQFLLGGVKCPF